MTRGRKANMKRGTTMAVAERPINTEQQLLRGPSTQRLQDSPKTMDVPSMVRISREI